MYEANSLRQQMLDNALLEMIASDMQPSSIVNDKGSNKFVNLLDSRYHIPSRRNLMPKLPTKYEEVKARVKKCLESVAHVCLTTDIWTSRATQGYITVTCHFLDELWQMQTFVLETFNLTVSHTADKSCGIGNWQCFKYGCSCSFNWVETHPLLCTYVKSHCASCIIF